MTDDQSNYDYDNIINILVGPELQRFTAYKEADCLKSKIFQAACTDRWLRVKIVRLPEVEPELFERRIDRVYTNDLTKNELPQSHQLKIKLYLLGNYLDDLQFRNKSMQLLLATQRAMKSVFLSDKSLRLVWDNTIEGSPPRKCLVDTVVWRMSSGRFAEMRQ